MQNLSITKTSPTNENQNYNENFKVVMRCRPPLQREVRNSKFISTVINNNDNYQVQVSEDCKKICLYQYNNIETVQEDQLEEYF